MWVIFNPLKSLDTTLSGWKLKQDNLAENIAYIERALGTYLNAKGWYSLQCN